MARKIDSFGTVVSEGGMAALHPTRALPIYVAPSTRDEFATKNEIRLSLDPIACWRLDNARFEFDSSFVLPDAAEELGTLARMIKTQPDMPMSIFAHADPVGNDDYNITLSGRRAKSIYGILTRNADVWEELWAPFGGDNWDTKGAANTMLVSLGFGTTPEEKKRFRTEHGLSPGDGYLHADGRKKLYIAYMDSLCPVTITPKAFLAAGADKSHKGDYQGCGKFNPILLLSDKENKDLSEKERNEENSPNRRVVVFFYEPGTQVDPKKWPCPSAVTKAGASTAANVAACNKRFWSDAKDRKKPAAEDRRVFKDTFDTFECRFYQRMAGWSPCEGGQKVTYWTVRLLLPPEDGPPTTNGKPLANEPFLANIEGDATRRVAGQTDDDGILRIRAHAEHEQIVVKIAEREIRFRAGAMTKLDATSDNVEVKERLFNLGYGHYDPVDWSTDEFDLALRVFQEQHGVAEAELGKIGSDTIAKLKKFHDGIDDAGGSSSSGATGA